MVADVFKGDVIQLFESLHGVFSASLEKSHLPGLPLMVDPKTSQSIFFT